MKRDIIINYGILEDLCGTLQSYKTALENIDDTINTIDRTISDGMGEAMDALKQKKQGFSSDIEAVKGEVTDLLNIFDGYINDMYGIIRPLYRNYDMRVSRNDIWWNLNSINTVLSTTLGSNAMYMTVNDLGFFPSEEESARRDRNSTKLTAIRTYLIEKSSELKKKGEALMDLHERKIIPYENMDDEYSTKAGSLYDRYTNFWEGLWDGISDVGIFIWNFVKGVIVTAYELVVGLLGMVWGLLKYIGGAIVVGFSELFGTTPWEWAKESFESGNKLVETLWNDPALIIEGLCQQANDTVESKGFAYSIGAVTLDVAIEIIGTKGLGKLGKMKYLSKFDDFIKAGGKLDDFIKAGGKLDDLIRAGAKLDDLIKLGAKIDDLIKAGAKIDDLVKAGAKLDDLIKAGAFVDDLIAAGAKLDDLIKAGAKVDDLVKAGIKVDDLVKAGAKVDDMIKAGIKVDELVKAGAKIDDLIKAGVKVDDLIKAGAKVDDLIKAGVKVDDILEAMAKSGNLAGSANGLTAAEKKVVCDLLEQGKKVEIIPKDPNSINKTPDFKIDGVKTELKTLLNANTNTGMKRIQDAIKQGAKTVIIDARESGLTLSQAKEILSRACGKYPDGKIPANVEIWIDGQVVCYP